MVTSAYYEFWHQDHQGDWVQDANVYCNSDNHPSGAAERLLAAIENLNVAADGYFKFLSMREDRRSGLAFAFIQGNMDAETTKDIDANYLYQIEIYKDKPPEIAFRSIEDEGPENPKTTRMPLANFINKRLKELELKGDPVVVAKNLQVAGMIPIATKSQAQKMAQIAEQTGYLNDAKEWRGAIAPGMEEEGLRP